MWFLNLDLGSSLKHFFKCISFIFRKRTVEAVNEILNFAKLTRNDLLPTSQALFFTPTNLHEKSFRLLELNNDLLKNIEDNEPLYIKGCDDDELVICSQTSTYHVSSAETSNSLLLVTPPNYFNDVKENAQENIQEMKVCGIFQECLETKIAPCSLNRLRELLKDTVYKGPEFENDIDVRHLYTLQELKNVVQASESEFNNALSSMDIFEIDGYMRELDFEYHFRVLSYMLKLIDENSWTLDTIDYNETCDLLKDFVPEEIVKCLFKRYTTESKMLDGVQLYKYKEADVCQFFARVILRTAGKFNLDEFLQAWNDSVPEGMTPNEEMLYGVAIVNRKTNPKVIWAFEESNLPNNVGERFQILFDAKDKWAVPEIAPYIR